MWNLLGQGAPLLAALFAIPIIIRGLGMERFGVLALAWIFIGYFSLFDLGMGRALTHSVAKKLGAGQTDGIPTLVWTGLGILFLISLLGMLGGLLAVPFLVHSLLQIPGELTEESVIAFRIIAVSFPIIVSSASLQGILEAYQRFGILNAVRIPQGIFNFIGPLVVLIFSPRLYLVVAILVMARLIAWLVYLCLCFRIIPELRHQFSIQRTLVKPLVVFGGWITAANIIIPLMTYMDRFLIGAVLSTTAVAYYAAPYEMVTRLRVIPVALVGVLFPAFAATHKQDPGRTAHIFTRGVSYTFLIMFPLVLLVVTFAHEGLTLWLDPDFARNSTLVLQFIGIGVFLSSLNRLPVALVQSAGRPDLTTKINLAELVFYLPLLWWLTREYGIAGTAFIWTARVVVDTVLVFLIALRISPASAATLWRLAIMTVATLIVLAVGSQLSALYLKVLFLFLMLLSFFIMGWLLILIPHERKVVCGWLKALSFSN